RRFKNEEVLRIGVNDISGDLSVEQVAFQLASIAEAVLDKALGLAGEELRARYGEPRSATGVETLAGIGMGKLGGQALGYQSDLDLIFVYSGASHGATTAVSPLQPSHHQHMT